VLAGGLFITMLLSVLILPLIIIIFAGSSKANEESSRPRGCNHHYYLPSNQHHPRGQTSQSFVGPPFCLSKVYTDWKVDSVIQVTPAVDNSVVQVTAVDDNMVAKKATLSTVIETFCEVVLHTLSLFMFAMAIWRCVILRDSAINCHQVYQALRDSAFHRKYYCDDAGKWHQWHWQ
jgi:hypothetical protein